MAAIGELDRQALLDAESVAELADRLVAAVEDADRTLGLGPTPDDPDAPGPAF